MRSLVGLALCLPSLLRYVFLLLSFLFNHSSSTFLCIGNIQTKHLYQTGPAASAFIDPPSLPWSVYVYGPDGFAREQPIGRNINVTSYPFPDGTRTVSSLSFFFYFSCVNTCSNNFFFKIQPTIQEYEELVWLAGNLKLELIEYSRQLYNGEDVDDEDDGGGGGGLELTPSQ